MKLEKYKEMIRDYVFDTKEEREAIHSDSITDSLFTNAMQYAYIALNSIEKLEEIARTLIGTTAGIELDEILKKFHDYHWQETAWRDFYMRFNDDNEMHCEYAFLNHHFETAREIEESNMGWLKEVINHSSSPKEIIEIMPSARFFMSKDMILNDLKGE